VSTSKVVITGAMGAGKTTVGRALAQRLGWPLRDSDDDISQLTGYTGARIALRDNIEALHALEAKVLLQALATPGAAVINAAGSTIESAGCREAMQQAFVVWLDPPEDVLAERRRSGSHRRLLGSQEAQELARRRRPWLERIADLRIDTRIPPDATASSIIDAMSSRGPR
jgi:shikimate kinase